MTSSSRTLVLVLPTMAVVGVVALVGPGCSSAGGPATVTWPTPPAVQSQTVSRVVGVAGCASAACHGAPAAPDAPRWMCSAYEWLGADPHRRAYHDLETPLATEIMRKYAGTNPDGSPKVAATDEVRCLACHTTPSLAAPGHSVSLRAEGVSCEACHGNADRWLGSHTGFTAANRAQQYAATGMHPLYDLGERAVTCAGCHVGAPADPARGYPVRDMNHDMIAAGHPRLNFDFADAMFRLPRHWDERERVPGVVPPAPTCDERVWLVGRVAIAEAACRLLADRATASSPERPWPELAEYRCASCHHRLQDGYRPAPRNPAAKPGFPVWQSVWPPIGDVRDARTESLNPLWNAVERPHPDAGRTAAAATTAAGQFENFRQELMRMPESGVREGAMRLRQSIRPELKGLDRDGAGRVFHMLAAFERGNPKPDPARRAKFDQLRDELTARRPNVPYRVPVNVPNLLEALAP